MAVKDRGAFGASLEKLMRLPIKLAIPGHGVIFAKNAKEKVKEPFSDFTEESLWYKIIRRALAG